MVFHSTGVYGLFYLVLDVTLTQDCCGVPFYRCLWFILPSLRRNINTGLLWCSIIQVFMVYFT